MNDERMIELLKQADAGFGPPRPANIGAAAIRARIRRRRAVTGGMCGIAATVLLLTALWLVPGGTNRGTTGQDQRIASLEEQVRELKTQTEQTLALVRDVLAQERQQDRLRALETELASIPDPVERMNQQAEKTAFALVYQADRMYREMNQVQSAIETYEQVIRLYPQNHWAEVAKQRISEIKDSRTNKPGLRGETQWNSNATSAV